MNNAQTKLLKARLDGLYKAKRMELCHDAPMPRTIAVAHRMLLRWRAQQNRVTNRRRERLAAAHSAAFDAVISEDDVKRVLRALQAFERYQP